VGEVRGGLEMRDEKLGLRRQGGRGREGKYEAKYIDRATTGCWDGWISS
jgi:hypothetical protein